MITVKNEGLARRLNKLNKWEDLLTPPEWRGYYKLLSGSEKVMYDKLLTAICECQYCIRFSFPTVFSDEDVGRILHFVLYDNPAIFSIDEYDMWDILSDDHLTINIPFTAPNSMIELNRRIDVLNAIKKILSDNENVYVQSDIDKELFVHDYICGNVSFDDTMGNNGNRFEPYSIYGPLIEKTGVCEGIAKLTKLLLEILGIRSFVVSGVRNNPKKPKHVWNLVESDGKAFHMDVSMDLCETQKSENLLRRDFFNISDTIMDREVSWSGKGEIWQCDSFDLNYVYLVGGYISFREDCIEYIKKKLLEHRSLIYIRLNKKTLGDIDDQNSWVQDCFVEAAKNLSPTPTFTFLPSELNGLLVLKVNHGCGGADS